jgi:PPOX class probable F420-dependent enzyme
MTRMPTTPVPPAIAEFLDRPNLCVMAVLRPDGSPHTTAIWYRWLGDDRVLVNMDDVRPRLRWLRRDGRVAFTCIDPETFYRQVSLIGVVEEIYDDADRADIHELARRYTGRDYPRTRHPRVSVRVRVDRWHGWDRDPSEPARPERDRLPV